MTKLSFPLLFAVFLFPTLTNALGSGSTLAVVYGTATVCAIVASEANQRIICYRAGSATSSAVIPIEPNVSYSAVAGGRTNFCALRSGGYSLLCWDTNTSLPSFPIKRIYNNNTALLQSLSIGDERICATAQNSTPPVNCWRTDGGNRNNTGGLTNVNLAMDKITSGFGFSCGIVPSQNSRVTCWGNSVGQEIERQFGNMSMANIEAGVSHVCGVNTAGELVCRGDNSSGQLDVPLNRGLDFASGLALGDGFSCVIRRTIRTVVCWGSMNESSVEGIEFESIVAGLNFTCGLTTRNFSVFCWGPGWPGPSSNFSINELPLRAEILPGPCIDSPCSQCGLYPQSSRLCFGSGNICRPSPCFNLTNPSPPPPLSPLPTPDVPRRTTRSRELSRGLLAFAIVGSVGGFMGICTVVYCLWTGVCFGKKKVHNSVQPTITRAGSNGSPGSNNGPPSRSLTIRRQGSRSMKRQRSGTSSKHADKAEEFSLAELADATNNFSHENKIGAGSFGVVYRGKLLDGREVAIKRGETGQKTMKYQEKETAFDSELAFLSRLHHKHLVRLVGYCEERDERLLVYEYMKNGALYDHLHNKNNIEKSSSLLNSWKMRIKITLDAARGIEYLHNYAVPSIIHRDIKSSNILLDANWTARVSDFGLSMMGPESDQDYRPTKAAGTVGYIDPEYYGLNILTTKSDVYGLGVVMLELLTGKRAIFKNEENGGNPMSLVDFAVPAIMAGELAKVLDIRVGPPEMNEAEAVELMAYTAMHCVNLEGKERPTISDIVFNLERAVTVCHGSHGSISSGGFETVSE
ncbi:putative serine/threonine-protein kinase-like protein CCR3 [Hibiscus syriacus]|uniref:non-specific serine/threonine protein kinase n=1 Tax=Hibiscus syriacus TaxID=106335 RepID=A0A6A3CWL3_HIBSY|nr:putative serine/threonine-protein kinase-like protein CCR3 [Hibiscus syriacus]KAE8732897.1 putative serine/threonine-protein kinase-like protein CCR3 [Hibiscus syriacus]